MPMKYDTETRAKAIRLVTEQGEDYACEYEAIKTVAGRLGMNPETLCKWTDSRPCHPPSSNCPDRPVNSTSARIDLQPATTKSPRG